MKEIITLTVEERKQLEHMLKAGRRTPREIKRAEILLEAEQQGKELNKARIGRKTGCSYKKVNQVIQRFLKHHELSEALGELPRPGQPRLLSEKDEGFVIATACSKSPEGVNHWTLELLQKEMAEKRGKEMSIAPIRKVLLKNSLKPWKKKDVVHSGNNATISEKHERCFGTLCKTP